MPAHTSRLIMQEENGTREDAEQGVTRPLEQADPGSDPSPREQPTVPGTARPVSILQENDKQLHGGFPETPPYDVAAPSDTFGLRHVRIALSDLVFPLRRGELLDHVGHWRIPTTGTHFHLLRDYFEGMDRDTRFGSAEDVVRAIARAHPELR